MIKNRKKVEDKILKYINKLAGNDNVKLYTDLFKSMNNAQFHKFMENLKNKKSTLSIIVPNEGSVRLDTETNLKLCRELGYEPFQRIVTKIPGTNIKTLSNITSLVMYMPVRRLSQHMEKKISLADDLHHRNSLTNQVTGKSKSTKITSKVLNIYLGKGYTGAMEELMMARTGDLDATNAMNAFIAKYGEVSLADIKRFAKGSKSTQTMKTYFKSMHIKINI